MSIIGGLFGLGGEEWMDEGVCATVDPELFFPPIGHPAMAAKRICMSCPVLAQCRDYALSSPTPLYGIWGATGARERQDIRAKQKRNAA